jgi:hypothetical protein
MMTMMMMMMMIQVQAEPVKNGTLPPPCGGRRLGRLVRRRRRGSRLPAGRALSTANSNAFSTRLHQYHRLSPPHIEDLDTRS